MAKRTDAAYVRGHKRLYMTATLRSLDGRAGVLDYEAGRAHRQSAELYPPLLMTATEELHRNGGRYALCTMCIGVGQGIATVIERA